MSLVRIAKSISHFAEPPLWWLIMSVVLVYHSGLEGTAAVLLLGLALLGDIGLPLLLVIFFRKTGRVSDWDITDVRERRWLFTWGALLHGISTVSFLLMAASPIGVIRLCVWLAECVVVGITWFWKISIHTSTYTMAVIAIAWLGSIWWSALLLLLPIVMWARVYLQKHTVAQVFAGVGISLLTLYIAWLIA